LLHLFAKKQDIRFFANGSKDEIEKIDNLKRVIEEHNQNLQNLFMLQLKIARRWHLGQ